MKPYLKLPAIIGVIGASALATNLAVVVAKPSAERAQVAQPYDDGGRGAGTGAAQGLKPEQR